MKRFAVGLIAIIVVVPAIALLAPLLVDLNDYKADIARGVEAAIERRLVIAGDIEARILPTPRATLRGIRLADREGGEGAVMATLDSIEIDLALLPLLRGDLRVRRVTLVRPVIDIKAPVSGSTELEFPIPGFHPPGSAAGSLAVRIDRIMIAGGQVSYRDSAGGDPIRFGAIAATFAADTLDGPVMGTGEFVLRGTPIEFAVTARTGPENGVIALAVDFGLLGTDATIGFRGRAIAGSGPGRVRGKLRVAGGRFGELLAAVARLRGDPADRLPDIDQPYSLTASIDASARDVALDDLAFELGENIASGAISAFFGERTEVEVALSVNRLDGDGLLAALAREAAADGSPRPSREGSAPAWAPAFPLSGKVAVSAAIVVEALHYRSHVVRRAAFDAALENGTIHIRRLVAALPGGSDLVVDGTLTTVHQEPFFEGRLRVDSDNMRALLDWLAIDSGGIAVDRLRKLVLSSRLRLTREVVQLYDVDMTLDSTRLRGGAAYALRARPSFSIDATLDRLNVDTYLPHPVDPENRERRATASAEAGGAPPLAILDSFDANFNLAAASLTYGGQAVVGLTADLALRGGELIVRRLATTGIAGVAGSLSGRARGFAAEPVVTTDFDLRIANPSRLARLLDIDQPMIARIGEVSARGSLAGTARSLALDATLETDGLRAVVSGRVDAGGRASDAAVPVADLALDVASPDLAAFLRRFHPALDTALMGRVEMVGTVKGTAERLAVDLAANAAGSRAVATGSIVPADPLNYELRVALSHPDLAALLAEVGTGYRPPAPGLGVSVQAALAGSAEQVRLRGLDAAIGPARFSGDVALSFGGERPWIEADIRAGEIPVDLLLPRGTPAQLGGGDPSRAAQRGANRWARTPVDLGFARAFDGSVRLASRAISWGAYRFIEPRLELTVSDGVVDVDPFLGELFGGELRLAAKVDAGATPHLDMSLDLRDADLAAVLDGAAGVDILAGRVDLAGRFTAHGRSQEDVISTLAGEGTATAREGSVMGIDLPALRERLGRSGETADGRLLTAAMSGGVTAFRSAGLRFHIDRGVVVVEEARADLDGAEGTARSRIDLPRWHLDLESRLRFAGYPEAPALGLDLRGAVDAPRRELRGRDFERFLARRTVAPVSGTASGDVFRPETGTAAPRPSNPASGPGIE